jgi:hypothetical protein
MSRKKKEKRIEIKTGIAEYAVMCCGILACIRHTNYKECKRCGKVLKDTRNEK